MTASIAVTGIGEASPAPSESLETLVYRAASAALSDAGVERDGLDGIAIAASDQVDGRAISSMLTAGPAGAYLNEEINIASSPGHALAAGSMQLLSGDCRRLLVSSWGKASESASAGGTQAAQRLSAEPFFERDGGSSQLAAAAMQAQLRRSRATDPGAAARAAATVAARNHGRRSAAEVAASPLVAHPLRELECPPEVDGAFSIVIERLDRDAPGGVTIDGFGWCSEPSRIADRDALELPGLRRAGADAFRRASVSDPVSEIGAWELHDYTPDAELLACDALGLCQPGDVDGLAFEAYGRINAAGGSVRGEAPFGGALRKVLQAVRQLRGIAGDGQLPGVERACAQLASGFAGQFQTVFVLGRAGR